MNTPLIAAQFYEPPTDLTSMGIIPAQPSSRDIQLKAEYNPREFQNREAILDVIRLQVQLGRDGGSLQRSVLLITGVQGAGKSWCLQHVTEHLYPCELPTRPRDKGVVAVYADLVQVIENDEYGNWGGVLAQSAMVLEQRIFAKLDKLNQQPLRSAAGWLLTVQDEIASCFSTYHQKQPLESNTLVKHAAEVAAERFVNLIDDLATFFVPILAFDSLDLLDDDPQYRALLLWFEKYILAPLVRPDQNLILMASRGDLRRLRLFEVRRRVKRLDLPPLPQPKEANPVSNLLFPYTFGHPWATSYLQQHLDLQSSDLLSNADLFAQKQAELKEQESSVVKDLLNSVEKWLFQGVALELAKQIKVAATLRYFHIRSLQMILASVEQREEIRQKSDVDIQRLIGQMVETNLVRWSTERHGYEVDPTVRRILNQTQRLYNQAEYMHRHACAFQLYKNWIEDAPFAGDRFVIEAAYHGTELCREQPDRQDEIQQDLAILLESVLGDHVSEENQTNHRLERADALWQQVRQDEDLQGSPFLELFARRIAA
jgi:hypothetical protein